MHDAAWLNADIATMAAGYGAVRDGVVAVTDGKLSWVGPRSEWRSSAR
jgi:imidazolonepropionase-like amidohydrolase